MAIEFVSTVGDPTSTSYIDVTYFKQYWENRGVDFNSTSQNDIKAWLNIATEHMDNTYSFWGTKSTETQALQFPRSGIEDRNGVDIADNIIPDDIKKACAEIAKAYYEEEDLNQEPGIKTRAIGDVTLEYRDGITQLKYQNALKYLRHYIYFENRKVRRV